MFYAVVRPQIDTPLLTSSLRGPPPSFPMATQTTPSPPDKSTPRQNVASPALATASNAAINLSTICVVATDGPHTKTRTPRRSTQPFDAQARLAQMSVHLSDVLYGIQGVAVQRFRLTRTRALSNSGEAHLESLMPFVLIHQDKLQFPRTALNKHKSN